MLIRLFLSSMEPHVVNSGVIISVMSLANEILVCVTQSK